MTTCREPEHTDTLRIDVPFPCMTAHHSYSALCVLQWGGVARNARRLGHTVLDERGVHADGIQPGADLGPFQIGRQNAIATAREYNNGCAGISLQRRGIESNAWLR